MKEANSITVNWTHVGAGQRLMDESMANNAMADPSMIESMMRAVDEMS